MSAIETNHSFSGENFLFDRNKVVEEMELTSELKKIAFDWKPF